MNIWWAGADLPLKTWIPLVTSSQDSSINSLTILILKDLSISTQHTSEIDKHTHMHTHTQPKIQEGIIQTRTDLTKEHLLEQDGICKGHVRKALDLKSEISIRALSTFSTCVIVNKWILILIFG